MAKSLLWYGHTGSFKTTQIKFIARYIYEKYGKITRVIYTGGSDGGATQPEERAGIVESWKLGLRDNPLPVLRRLARGYWPKVVEDKGQLVIQLQQPNAETWKKVGAVVIDSLSMAADEGMRDTIDKGRPMAQDPVTPFREKVTIVNTLGRSEDAEEVFAAPAKAHYGFGQNFAVGIINALSSLPCELIGFTTLEKKSEEEDSGGRQTIYGPEMPGKVLTPKIPSLVGDCLHFDQYFVETLVDILDASGQPKLGADKKPLKEKLLETKVKAYFMRHPDPKTGIVFPAKPRVPTDKYKDLLKKWPGGYFEPTLESGIDMYLRFMDELENQSTDSLKSWREETDKRMGRAPVIAATK